MLLMGNITLVSPPTVMLFGITSMVPTLRRGICRTGMSMTTLLVAFLNSGLS